MSAYFITVDGKHYTIGNSMSIINAGFFPVAEYYNYKGETLTYYKHANGYVIARFCPRKYTPFIHTYNTTDEANEYFKEMNRNQTFKTGKWIKKRNQ